MAESFADCDSHTHYFFLSVEMTSKIYLQSFCRLMGKSIKHVVVTFDTRDQMFFPIKLNGQESESSCLET